MKSSHDQSAPNTPHPPPGHQPQRLPYDSPADLLSNLSRAHHHQQQHHHHPYYPSAGVDPHVLHHHASLLPDPHQHCRRSLSGSETDISTSTENLTHEEQYVLRNSTRQEPQGEETLDLEDSGGGGGGVGVSGAPAPPFRGGSWISATTGLGSSYASMDQSSCKTLIIHGMDHDDDFADNGGGSGCDDEDFGDVDDDDVPAAACDERRTPSRHHRHRSRGSRGGDDVTTRQQQQQQLPTRSAPPHYCQQQQQQHLPQYGSVQPPHYASACTSGPMLPQEITDIPRHYLDQSEVLKHLLAKEMQVAGYGGGLDAAMLMPYASHHVPQYVHQAFFGTDFDLSQLPPPPEYPGRVVTSSSATTLSSAVSKMSLASPSSETTDSSTATATSPSDSSPGFPGTRRVSAPVSSAASLLSRSQPDLSRWGGEDAGSRGSGHFSPRPRTKGKASPDVSPSLLHQRAHSVKYGLGSSVDGGGDAGATFDKLNRALLLENRQLKADLDIFTTKVSRLQKFEVDIQKVHHAYEELVKSSQKRETLNQAVRVKLELEVRRLHDLGKDLKDQLDSLNGNLRLQRRPTSEDNSESGKQELQCRDQFIAQLIQQNKELTAAKERHEIELAAQRATLQEQRTHIDILDSALTNAQANVVRLEEECRKKSAHAERVAQLQRALTALQVASERREQMERKLRNQLERDLNELRQRHLVQRSAVAVRRNQCLAGGVARSADSSSTGDLRVEGGGGGSSSKGESGGEEAALCEERTVDDLKSALRGKEERIMALETSLSKWEQRYLEENAMRQIAIDAASMPKDAKIAALERTSQESEKLIAEARTDKLRHMDELHLANRRCTDLESKSRDLESRLAERDAMIRVLQQHSIDRDAAFHSAMLRSPRHTPHGSLIHPTAASTSSASARGVGLFISGSGDETIAPTSTRDEHLPSSATTVDDLSSEASGSTTDATATQESLDEQLKKLDSQLLSKDSIINALRSEKEKYPSHYWMV